MNKFVKFCIWNLISLLKTLSIEISQSKRDECIKTKFPELVQGDKLYRNCEMACTLEVIGATKNLVLQDDFIIETLTKEIGAEHTDTIRNVIEICKLFKAENQCDQIRKFSICVDGSLSDVRMPNQKM